MRAAIVRGTPVTPLSEAKLELYRASSKVRVLEQLIAIVGDGVLYANSPEDRVYLARVTYADMITFN